MLAAAITIIALVGTITFVFVRYADSWPKPFLRTVGYLFLIVSTIELIILFWVLGYVAISDWSLWGLSFDAFWKEQLSAIYFIKEWLFTWFWNDLLNLLFVFLPAVVFITLRTIFTTFLGFWALAASKE